MQDGSRMAEVPVHELSSSNARSKGLEVATDVGPGAKNLLSRTTTCNNGPSDNAGSKTLKFVGWEFCRCTRGRI